MRDIEQPGGSVDHAPAVSILCDSGSLDKVAASVFGDGRGSNASGLSRPSREKPTNSERLRYSPVKGRDAETRNNFRITDTLGSSIREVLDQYDVDQDGRLDATEMAQLARSLLDQRQRTYWLKWSTILLLIFVALLLGANFGITWAVVSYMKDVKVGDNGMMYRKGTTELVRVGSAEIAVQDGMLYSYAQLMGAATAPNKTSASASLATDQHEAQPLKVPTATFAGDVNTSLPMSVLRELRYFEMTSALGAEISFQVLAVARLPDMQVKLVTAVGTLVLAADGLSYEEPIGRLLEDSGFRSSDTVTSAGRRLLGDKDVKLTGQFASNPPANALSNAAPSTDLTTSAATPSLPSSGTGPGKPAADPPSNGNGNDNNGNGSGNSNGNDNNDKAAAELVTDPTNTAPAPELGPDQQADLPAANATATTNTSPVLSYSHPAMTPITDTAVTDLESGRASRRNDAKDRLKQAKSSPVAFFREWQRKYDKNYPSKEAEDAAFSAWQKNLDIVDAINDDPANTWFADLTDKADVEGDPYTRGAEAKMGPQRRRATLEEVDALLEAGRGAELAGLYVEHDVAHEPAAQRSRRLLMHTTPCADWRTRDSAGGAYECNWLNNGQELIMNPVQDQKKCGSCTAFATSAAVEAHHVINGGSRIKISDQHLLSCGHPTNTGCTGAPVDLYLNYRQTLPVSTTSQGFAVSSADEYPYMSGDAGVNYACNATAASRVVLDSVATDTATGWPYVLLNGEAAIADALTTKGPVVTAMYTTATSGALLSSYTGGIWNSDCQDVGGHAVVIVGMGRDSAGIKYWLVRNSWGPYFGEAGHFRIGRGANLCGIEAFKKNNVIDTRYINALIPVMKPATHVPYKYDMNIRTSFLTDLAAPELMAAPPAGKSYMAQCAEACDATAGCAAWTWDTVTNSCGLTTDGLQSGTASDTAISGSPKGSTLLNGYSVTADAAMPSSASLVASVTLTPVTAMTFVQQCAVNCEANTQCHAFSFNNATNTCSMFFSVLVSPVAAVGVTTGIRKGLVLEPPSPPLPAALKAITYGPVFCARGGYVRGIIVYSQTNQGAGNTGAADDLGALYMPFLCVKGSSYAELYAGPTRYGVAGAGFSDGGAYKLCSTTDQAAAAIRLKVQADQTGISGGDQSGINNAHMLCRKSGAVTWSSTLTPMYSSATNGEGGSWGSWGDWAVCPSGTAICGYQTFYHPTQGFGDDASLSGLRAQCCRLPA